MRSNRNLALLSFLGTLLASAPALAGGHTWDVNELFSNADGTIQFIELKETGGGANEINTANHDVTSTTSVFTIPANVASPTSFRHILLGTPAFAALPGAPTPDYLIPANFFSTSSDTITYVPYDVLSFGPGNLPTDGINSLLANHTTGVNSPTNYANQTGSVDASPAGPPAVPDGSSGTPVTAEKLDPAGASLTVRWDDSTCTGATGHQLIYGEGSQLPSAPGGTFGVAGSACAIGASPFTWSGAPDATDGTGLIWWLVLATDGAGTEGSWGRGAGERQGPGPDGSSGQCGSTTKDLSNGCGQ